MEKKIIKPGSLNFRDTFGVFTPSYPANVFLKEKFKIAIENFNNQNLRIELGKNTKKYTAKYPHVLDVARVRAEELNELFKDKKVRAIISNIGGYCSASILQYLDIDLIKKNPKFLIGYSDITAIHCFLQKKCNLVSIYGPALTPSFGENENLIAYTSKTLQDAVGINRCIYPNELIPPKYYTKEFIDATQKGWQSKPKKMIRNSGWKPIHQGMCIEQIFVANQNTLLSLAGTDYFPNIKNKLLVLEQMNTSLAIEERQLNHLKNLNVFKDIKGLIISKQENTTDKNFEKFYNELLLDFVQPKNGFPIAINFDCGHTQPICSIPQSIKFKLNVLENKTQLIQTESAYY